MATHTLKTWPEPFGQIVAGRKTFELRRNDRGFQVGDRLRLQEFNPHSSEYTNREFHVRVCYMIEGPSEFGGVEDGFCIMAIKPVYREGSGK